MMSATLQITLIAAMAAPCPLLIRHAFDADIAAAVAITDITHTRRRADDVDDSGYASFKRGRIDIAPLRHL